MIQKSLKETIKKVLNKPIGINHYQSFYKSLQLAKSILYLVDNTGEIVFDKLLLQAILDLQEGNPIEKITVVVKGHPVINDAMLDDVYEKTPLWSE